MPTRTAIPRASKIVVELLGLFAVPESALLQLPAAGIQPRDLSEAWGRARIAAPQPARWAKARGGKVVTIALKKRRWMSAIAIA